MALAKQEPARLCRHALTPGVSASALAPHRRQRQHSLAAAAGGAPGAQGPLTSACADAARNAGQGKKACDWWDSRPPRAKATGSNLVLRRGPVHHIFNTGDVPMDIVGVFGATPVLTLLPDGQPLPLPWRT